MSKEKFKAIESELQTRYIDRDEQIHGMVLATLSGHHIELLGPPGNAKSMLIRDYAEYLQASHFQWLMTKFTTPDEIFGPVDIAAMKLGVFKRITTGKMPESQVVFLDEVFKANSPILNSLLSILQERLYYNNGTPMKCPLIFCVGSSNELPDEDEGLGALHDRFLIRYNIGYLQDSSQFEEMLKLKHGDKLVKPITEEALLQDKQEVKVLVPDDETIESMLIVWERLREEGITPSDRRYKQMLDVMAAESWLLGATNIVAESLIVGVHILWDKPEQINVVNQIVRTSVNPSMAKAQEILTAAREAVESVGEYTTSDEIVQILKQLRQLLADVGELKQTRQVEAVKTTVKQYQEDIYNKMVGGGDDATT